MPCCQMWCKARNTRNSCSGQHGIFCKRHVIITKAWYHVHLKQQFRALTIYIAGWVVRRDLQCHYLRYFRGISCKMIHPVSQREVSNMSSTLTTKMAWSIHSGTMTECHKHAFFQKVSLENC